MHRYDAVIVGAGPNGLAAAVRLAQAGRSVLVAEANPDVGGAARSEELTLPGFVHDTFSGVYPLGIGSPFFSSLPLREHGLEWIHASAPLAHPFDDGTAAILERSLDATAAPYGRHGDAYASLIRPFLDRWSDLISDALDPFSLPRHPLLLARFGLVALRSAVSVATRTIGGHHLAALFAGSAAHSGLPIDARASAAYGMVLNLSGHAVGWPIVKGGAGAITSALASYLKELGGEVVTDWRVRSLAELPPARAVLLSLTPRQIQEVAGDLLPQGYRRQLRKFRYGMGVYKVDWALSGPVPWRAAECLRAGTVHLGGSLEEMVEAEHHPNAGSVAPRPFVLMSQPSLFDPSRAPAGKHTAWGYCHVPNGFDGDVTDAIEAQVERFAPGFRDLIIARHVLTPVELERRDANLVGGDVNGGAGDLSQLFFRPTLRLNPYSTPVRGLFVCSASTPPGGAVHGMCGFNAAEAALREGL
jgi:phytoene dehydrogenase-like protein